MTKRYRKTSAGPRWKPKRRKDRQPPPPPAAPRPTRVKFYGGQFTPDELALIAACLQDLALDDEVWMQRVVNLRLLRVAKNLAPAAEAQADSAGDEAPTDEDSGPPADSPLKHLVHVAEALTAGAGRMARLLRDQRVLSGEAADIVMMAIGEALNQVSAAKGLDL